MSLRHFVYLGATLFMAVRVGFEPSTPIEGTELIDSVLL